MKIFPTGPSYCDAIKSLDRPSKSWASEACDTINTNTQIQIHRYKYICFQTWENMNNTEIFKKNYSKLIAQTTMM